ncbi:J domain-containing protein [Myroides odoratimimus]|uniref:J domain-containing protein n=1 Tax=Myroides odoratimimus CIP 101113 TaxID=883154 RepID=A0AAV3F2Z2_9FLAO|nr:J domain-containing protein [Myroides odoratimimus]EHO12447.1 hypothetical protein HMPREF9715_01602 [Myroides odoratimimus CIP 101113]SHM59535.1 DnaJ domain-containing protein [Myroides odoratimimus subsp. xuanwuensis]
MNKVNYYRVLGVNPTVSEEELKRAFQSLYERYSPDKNPSSLFYKTMFEQLNEAYATLGDREKREKYNIANGYEVPVYSRPEDKQEISKKKEKMVDTGSNNAYIFLFVVIGIIVVLGGYLVYYTFNESEDTEIKETVIVEQELPKPKATIKKVEVKPVEVRREVYTAEKKEKEHQHTESVKEIPVTDKAKEVKKEISVEKKVEATKVSKEEKLTKPSSKTDNLNDEFQTKKAFKIGASKNDVWAVQGDPTDIKEQGDIETWYYGKSKIRFKNGKVIDSTSF